MSYVISKDNGKGKPPSFFKGVKGFGPLQLAMNYATEAQAQDIIGSFEELAGCIVMPNDETLMKVSNEKSVEVLSGTKPDTGDSEN